MQIHKELVDAAPRVLREAFFRGRRSVETNKFFVKNEALTSLEDSGAWFCDDDVFKIKDDLPWVCEEISASPVIRQLSETTARSLVTERRSLERFLPGAPSGLKRAAKTFLATADAYFGRPAYPVGATLMLSNPRRPSTNTAEELHFDGQVRKVGGVKGCLKIFIAARQISQINGPLSFLDAEASSVVSHHWKYNKSRSRKRVTDEQAKQALGGDLVQFAKPWLSSAGGTLWLDTDRCLHFGSRSVGESRYVLQFEFTPPHGLDAILNRRQSITDRMIIDQLDVEKI